MFKFERIVKAVFQLFGFFFFFRIEKKSISYCDKLKYFNGFELYMNENAMSELHKRANQLLLSWHFLRLKDTARGHVFNVTE